LQKKIIKQTPYPDLPIQVKNYKQFTSQCFYHWWKIHLYSFRIVKQCSSEDALAFIISHEIGHIMGRHPKRGQKGETFAGLMIVLTKQKHLKNMELVRRLVS
jgi:hypothetical protein